jgi:hypothetical protein
MDRERGGNMVFALIYRQTLYSVVNKRMRKKQTEDFGKGSWLFFGYIFKATAT